MKCVYRLNPEHKKYSKVLKQIQQDEKHNLISNLKIEGTETLTLKKIIHHKSGEIKETTADYCIVTFDNVPKQSKAQQHYFKWRIYGQKYRG